MSFPKRIHELGEFDRPDHVFITDQDSCYFVDQYLSGGGGSKRAWELSDVNQLIHNFKKPLSGRNGNGWGYKAQAITKIANLFSGIWNWEVVARSSTACIPMPPSKARSHSEYDGRMHDVLLQLCALVSEQLDIRDCLSFSGKYPASHKLAPGDRPSIEQLYSDLTFCPVAGKHALPPDYILLFDDVLTTGRHFKAAQQKLNSVFPNTKVVGVFVARRVFPSASDVFDVVLDDL